MNKRCRYFLKFGSTLNGNRLVYLQHSCRVSWVLRGAVCGLRNSMIDGVIIKRTSLLTPKSSSLSQASERISK